MFYSKIESVEIYLPSNVMVTGDTEKKILQSSPVTIPVKAVSRLTGAGRRYFKDDNEQASDLAVKAAQKALYASGIPVEQIDLLIFASASQDLIEPATAHIISAKLETTCPVMDVKNACNSFINGIQVADSFIKTGVYKTVLIVTGETPSVSIRWSCKSKEQFMSSFPGYSMSDSGGAMILSSTENKKNASIEQIEVVADSSKWDTGVLDTGGSRNPRNIDTTYFNMDGNKLFEAFKNNGFEEIFSKFDNGIEWSDYKKIGVHQVSSIYTELLIEELKIPEHKIMSIIKEYGNPASNSLPIQLRKALDNNDLKVGDKFAFLGLGGGISTALGIFKI